MAGAVAVAGAAFMPVETAAVAAVDDKSAESLKYAVMLLCRLLTCDPSGGAKAATPGLKYAWPNERCMPFFSATSATSGANAIARKPPSTASASVTQCKTALENTASHDSSNAKFVALPCKNFSSE